MKKINLRSTVTNSENETISVESSGLYNEEENSITYSEEDLTVTIYIFKESVKIVRKNEDYNLNLEFKSSERIICNYEVKSVGLNIDLLVYTKTLEIKENYVYIHYDLLNLDVNIGSFEYKLIFWE